MLAELNRHRGTGYNLIFAISGFLAIAALLMVGLGPTLFSTLRHQEAARLQPVADKISILFEPNAGQSDGQVQFLAHAPGGRFWFTSSGVAIQLSVGSGRSAASSVTLGLPAGANGKVQPGVGAGTLSPQTGAGDTEVDDPASRTVSMSFVGASPRPSIGGDAPLSSKVSYLIGSDPSRWLSNLPTYGELDYTGLYPGIDLAYEGRGGQLKGTYTVSPGADPLAIKWRYIGASNPQPRVDAQGALQVKLDSPGRSMTITERAPAAWQEVDGRRVEVAARYMVDHDGTVGFSVSGYNHALPLVIDPTLTYSTYLGGNFADYGFGIAADNSGNFYVTGMTNSSNFPTVNPYQPNLRGGDDAVVAKFNAAGQPVYITYLGGSGTDWGLNITPDPDGNAYLTGFTSSTNFPVANAFQPTIGGGTFDAFVTKLNPTGSSLVFSTYLGGSGTENSAGSGPQSGAIAIDASRNVYVAGYTTSTNFPVLNAIQPNLVNIDDGFITKFNPAGSSLVWSTYLGGTRNDQPKGIAVDTQGNVVIAGFTTSSDYPTANAYQPNLRGTYDAFVSKINAAGSALVYSTYMGGSDLDYVDEAFDVAVDPEGKAYVTGFTGSPDFPIAGAAYQPGYNGGGIDAFLSRFSPSGSLEYSSFLGGNGSDDGESVAVNAAGEAYLFGSTQSTNYPTANPLFPNLRGSEDAFVTHFNAAGSGLIFSTYFGGSDNREMQAGGALAIDGNSNIYTTGNTGSSDFPTTPDAFQPFRASPIDAFVSRISEGNPTPTPTSVGTATPTPTVCAVSDYSITQTTGASIAPGTTFLPNSTCQDCTAPMVLPFPVQFYNQTFTIARASSNGNLQFTSDNHLPFNSCLPNPTYDNIIYAYWDDLTTDCTGNGCGIYTSVSGSAPNRIFNVEWRALRNEPPVVNIHFEIRLYENSNGRFDIIYGPLDNLGDSATVGVQYGTGSHFTQFSCDTAALSQGLQLSFTLPPCQATTPTSTPSNPTPTNTPQPMPTLAYSTYFGTSERDSIEAIGKDAAGDIYVAGTTFEIDNFGDIMAAKFSPDGQTLLWRRVIGGSRLDYGYALAVDAAGNATVAGIATSLDYPTLNAIQPTHHGGIYDGVLTKLDPQGNPIFSTYMGGNGADYADGLATDSAGNVYLTGHTESTNFPTTAGAFQTSNQGFYDGYVTKITPDGSSIVWSTYLGGMYSDESHAITIDTQGNVYLTGWTVSTNFPTLNPFQPAVSDNSGDAFVTKMNPSGTGLIYSTYLGGNNPPGPGEDNGRGIVVDAQGYAYVTGYTQAPNFPTTAGSYQPFFQGYFDAFVTKFTPAGNQLVYSTYLGGVVNPPYGDDEAFGIAVDSQGQAVITGKTYSPDFPILNAVQPLLAGVYDGFVTKFNASGSALLYSTYLGGNYAFPDFTGDDVGTGILIDSAGNAVIGGTTGSDTFPVANAYQFQNAGFTDGFISKITGSTPANTPTVSPTSPATSPTATRTSTATHTITPTVTGTPPTSTSIPLPTSSPTPLACTITFTDVPSGSAFYPYIECLACRGIISGYSDGTFRPNNNVTRGQAAKIVANAAQYNETIPPSQQTFSDVAPNSTFWVYIERVALHGAISGYSDGTFRPSNNVTRGQLAKIDAEVKGYNDVIPPAQQTFSDVPPNSTFWVYIERVALHGVVSGYSDGTYRPYNNVTRGQASKIVSKTFFPECGVR